MLMPITIVAVLLTESKERLDRAIEDYNRATQLNPDYADIYEQSLRPRGYTSKAHEYAKSDLVISRDMGRDIVTSFHSEYRNIPTEDLLEED